MSHAGLGTAADVLAQKPTAVIAYNDVMAIGVIKGMRAAGVRVPHDVSVIGFDNIALSAMVDPELTTVAAPLRAMGIIGVKNLIAAISGSNPSRDPVILPVKLLVRGSTSRRRRQAIPGPAYLLGCTAPRTRNGVRPAMAGDRVTSARPQRPGMPVTATSPMVSGM